MPNIDNYRNRLSEEGIRFPLTKIPNEKNGLISHLPSDHKFDGWPWQEQVNPEIYDQNLVWPKITIVTPSYNQADFLEQTIRSVLLQNYPNLEYIIIDGGSDDGSKEIIEKYSPWLSYYQSKKDLGQSNAINIGFSLGSGEYYAWINSDDYYLENVFHVVVSSFLKSSCEFIYGYGYNNLVNQKVLKLNIVKPLFDIFLRFPSLIQPSCFWSAKIHESLWEDLHCSLDYELWLRIIPGKKRALIKKPLSVANVHDNAKTSDAKMGEFWKNDHELICHPSAHGPVKYWKIKNSLNHLHLKLNQFIEKYF
ncbi:MAG: glycosyltransferase [Pedobacter sp.]|nr:MAG: glycosyltransferase [Pedobacter sp.]